MGGGGCTSFDVMKCGVIFYFVSLDPLEITHSILKEEGFFLPQLSKRGGILARGQKKICSQLPPPLPSFAFSGFMPVIACN